MFTCLLATQNFFQLSKSAMKLKKKFETVLIYIFVYLSVFVSRFCGMGNGTDMAGFGIKLRKTPDNGASEKEKRNIEEQLGAKSKKHQRKGKMDGPLDATFHRDVSSHSHSLSHSLPHTNQGTKGPLLSTFIPAFIFD